MLSKLRIEEQRSEAPTVSMDTLWIVFSDIRTILTQHFEGWIYSWWLGFSPGILCQVGIAGHSDWFCCANERSSREGADELIGLPKNGIYPKPIHIYL
jgi:hypothetical protein